jgi:anti-sigma B factor antagonist
MTRRVDPSFTVVSGPRSALVVMSGEFDHQAGKDLGVALLQLLNESPATVSLDMTAVEFIDSSGIEMLLRLYRRVVGEGGGTLRVTRSSDAARRTFAVCGLLETFGIDEAPQVA